MSELLQQLINGLSLGSVYALISLGYSMVYSVLRFINFAHGDVFMLGSFAALYAFNYLGGALRSGVGVGIGMLSLAVSVFLGVLVGILVERIAYRPLRERPRLTVLITAIGVSLFLQYSGQIVFGAAPRGFPALVPERMCSLGSVCFSSVQLVVLASTVFLLCGLTWIVMRTRLGLALRAVSLNPSAASLMGVDNDRVIAFTFGLSSGLAAAAGVFYGSLYQAIDPFMGVLPGLKAFIAAVLGGIGILPGAALGGIVLGVVETLVVGYSGVLGIPAGFRDGVAFIILIVVLMVRPAGLLGRVSVEKV